ncbi:MAG: FAD-dependent oxidoreductase [Flavobacteriales bacterium]|nr:FAD-dependent oxidoreductase [Flavobacteriales bacterium]
MEPSNRPVVIGGGAAGLAACLTLESAGHAPLLLEATHQLGGRLCTEQLPDGTSVDAGFQVLLTAYPELQRWLNLDTLDSVAFVPGARIYWRGRWRTLADPRRWPSSIPATLKSGLGTWGDWWRILRLVGEVRSGASGPLQSRQQEGTTLDFLHERGFSGEFIAGFLRPFFSGIFLDHALSPPPAQFLYTLRMFASGDVVRPVGGMRTLVDRLADGLKRTEVQFGQEVQEAAANEVTLSDGRIVTCNGVIDTLPLKEGVEWNGCFNAIFKCDHPTFGRPIIGLLPEARTVSNFHFMEDVQGAEGKNRLNVTALITGEFDREATEAAMRRDLHDAGLETGALEWCIHIPKALPRMNQVRSCLDHPKDNRGVYVAGDHSAAPSLDAALRSGRVAAEHWLGDRG